MFETYNVDGQKYEVSQDQLQRFLKDFPNAVQMGKAQGSTVDPTMSQSDTGSQSVDGSSGSQENRVNWFDQTWFGRGYAAASTTGEATDLFMEGSDVNMETIQEFIEAKKEEAKAHVPSERMNRFQKKYKENGSSWTAFFKGVSEEPSLMAELFVQSLGTQIGTFADSGDARVATGVGGAAGAGATAYLGYGAVAGGLAGAMGGLATSMETALTFGELIETELKKDELEFTDKNIKALLEGPKGKSIRNKALGRGLTIGAIEALTGGVAGKVTTKVLKTGAGMATKVAATAAGAAVEGIGGGIGEVGGRIAAGQEMDAAEIGFEAITGLTTAPVNVGNALLSYKTPVYKLNGKVVEYREMKDFVDTADDIDVAKANIVMENDITGLDAVAFTKQNKAITDSQIDALITDKKDRETLVELNDDKRKAEADAKKKGIDQVPGADAILEGVQAEIDGIIGKYEGAVGIGETQIAKDVAKAVQQNNLQGTIDFLQKNKNYAGKDVVIADDSAAAQVAHDKAVQEYNIKNPDNKLDATDVTGADGFIVGDVIVINKDVAGQTGQINVGAHELLHGIVAKHMRGLTTEKQTDLISDFTNTITKDQKDYVQKEIKRRIAAGEDLDINTTEEWLTVFSDGITKGDIKFNEGVFDKLKNFIQEIARKVGYKKEFANGRQVYNFMKDYQKSVKAGGLISTRAQSLAGGGTAATSTSRSMSTPLEAINKLIPKNIKTKKDYDAFVQDRRAFPAIFNATMGDGVISNYVKSKSIGGEYQGAIESVQNRLTNFDPEATRADGTTVGPEGFGEFIFANTRFGKLDSKKKLFEAGEKAKKTTTIDTKEAKEIEDTSTSTEVEDKSKARNLRDFDIEVEDGLVNAEIEAEVEALLEKNPDDIEVQMEKLILGDIRKSLDGIIGKIAKDKKTGKRGPTAEYETFIRNEYLEVVQSLGMETIRTAYRPWFEKKKIRTEKYKGISSKTDKVTNYVKDVFENKTNKREYIRWFLEGNERNLTERRTALIRRIARRKAKIATDSYIEANSKDIGKVVEAKLRQVSIAIENIQNEQKSFDAVKFSKTMQTKFDDILLRGNNGKPLTFKNGIYYGYTNPIDGKPQTFNDQGKIWEQAFSNYFGPKEIGGLGILGLTVKSTRVGEKGGMADFVFEILGFPEENHEIKAGLKGVRMGSVSLSNLNLQTGEFTLANKTHDNIKGIKDFIKKQIIPNIKKYIKETNKDIDVYNNENGFTKNDKGFVKQLTGNIVKGTPEKFPDVVYKKRTKGLGKIPLSEQVVENHYLNEGVSSITILATQYGNATFTFNDESIFAMGKKPAPRLKANVDAYASVRSLSSMKNGVKMRSFKVGIQFMMKDLLNTETEIIDATTKQGFMDATINVGISKPINKTKILDAAIAAGRTVSFSKSSKGITVLDFDDTLATSKSLIRFTKPDGTKGTLNAEQYASTYENLSELGYKFDFSEFTKVVDGKTAPLFNKAMKLQGKFGPENMFVLTARPAEAAPAIFAFLQANGLNIPLKNITGLANSTAEAKALWMVDKVSDGYNDFYFADDALQNVQAVDNILEQFDVKRKVQQARIKFSKSMNESFNDILENVTGIESIKRFSIIKGRKRGESKGKFRFFVPPSHEDFVGLLYNFMGKGKEGNAHRDFLEQALVRPLNRANREYDTARQSVANDYKELNKQFAEVKKKLTKKTPDGDFTNEDAIRVYLWNKHGHKIPGLSETDQAKLSELVQSDPQLQAYAETLNAISKQETYVNPTEGWNSGDTRMDLDDATGRIGRKQFFSEFIENADIIFSEENLNKIEAGYGKEVRESLEDILYRIQTGRNRPTGQNAQVNKLMNYLNGSVGTVMFFNMRSALLQQMSIVNYINFADNNIFAAAKAFANQKQYWADWSFIFNSDMLKQRRGGIQTDVNGAELAASLRNSKDVTRKVISKLLEIGFLPTQIGDNIAIATGGAAYYRNRINTYLKQGATVKEAEEKAFTDFQDITQSTQQSARPDMVSKQQASVIGKVILNFQNVTSQFNRLGKKAFQDIYNRRITKPNTTQMQSDISNAARITYYFAIQNMIFYTLQTALFAMMFDDDEEDVNNLFVKKKERLINGSIDSVLRGTGLIGGVVATLKNVAIAWARQRDVNYNPDESAVVVEALNLSPVLGIKARQIVNAEKTLNYNKKVIDEMETFDIDNPQWSAVTNYVQTFTNLPLNRLYNKTQNVRQALNNDHSAWERSLMFLGWSQYNLDLENKKMEDIKEKIKSKKKKDKPSIKKKTNKSRTIRF